MSKISIHAPRVGERPQEPPQRPTATTFQSTLPVWGATRTLCYRLRVQLFQSTLPAGGGSDAITGDKAVKMSIFQSTLPVWGATASTFSGQKRKSYFNPRSPCGERPPGCQLSRSTPADFNPRSPCGERLFSWTRFAMPTSVFQSTLPVWGATGRCGMQCRNSAGFNPRSPCGERRFGCRVFVRGYQFQSTLPVWGATSV